MPVRDTTRLDLPPVLSDCRSRRIGLLGGSFNPAHIGHLHVSREALRRLDLDQIWWLVSPQNPLKSARGMAPAERRVAGARAIASADPRIKVTQIETALGTRYTADTLDTLRRRFRRTRFVWLMGADNLWQIAHWQRWTRIFEGVAVAVFARPTYSLSALRSQAALRFSRAFVPARSARRLARLSPPAWSFFVIRLEQASATELRARARRGRFIGHRSNETSRQASQPAHRP